MTIHPLADVQSTNIGHGTTVWQYAVILKGAVIGKDCNINCHTFIENDVMLGDKVTIKSGVFIWDGTRINDDVFIGPSVVFTNDQRPRSKKQFSLRGITILNGASVGAGAIILPGITIGQYAMCGAGSVITKNVPDYALVYGNPASIRGWVDESGEKLQERLDGTWMSETGSLFRMSDNGLTRI